MDLELKTSSLFLTTKLYKPVTLESLLLLWIPPHPQTLQLTIDLLRPKNLMAYSLEHID